MVIPHETTDLIIYGATVELGWYVVKGLWFDSIAKYRPLTKEQKKLALLPFPLDLLAQTYWENRSYNSKPETIK